MLKKILLAIATIMIVNSCIIVLVTSSFLSEDTNETKTSKNFKILDMSENRVMFRNTGTEPINEFVISLNGNNVENEIKDPPIQPGSDGTIIVEMNGRTPGKYQMVLVTDSMSQTWMLNSRITTTTNPKIINEKITSTSTTTTPATTTVRNFIRSLTDTKKPVFYENFNKLCDVYTNPPEIKTSYWRTHAEFDSYGEGCHYAPNLGGFDEWTVELWYLRKGCSNDTRKHGEMFRTSFMRLADNYGTTKDLVLSIRRCNSPERRGFPMVFHSSQEMINNTWQHVAAVCKNSVSGSNIILYDNGVKVNETANLDCNCDYYKFDRLSIGLDYRDNVSYAWNGSLDEVKVWNRALTEDKIKKNSGYI